MNSKISQFEIGNVSVAVQLKDIKNVHLSVHPPEGKVCVSAPTWMSKDVIRVFVISKLSWIKRQQIKLKQQEREAPREYLNRESHFYNGDRYLLKLVPLSDPKMRPHVTLKHKVIELHINADVDQEARADVLNNWYRLQLKKIIPSLIDKYQNVMNVEVTEFGIKKMKTKWGSCNYRAKRIWINLELAKKPPECLEYIIVHEMTHLLESTHNARFIGLMDRFMPKWRFHRDILKSLPLKNESWLY